MGVFLKIIGIITIIAGILLVVSILGALGGIQVIISGVVLFSLGSIYDNVREIKERLEGRRDDKGD
jgi:uncharacterized membrane protein